MKKFLKNYTSNVPVSQTIYRIEQTLIRCGVTGITKEYGQTIGEVIAVRFHMPISGREATVRLPADKNKALEALWGDYVDGEKLDEKGNLHWGSKKRKKKVEFAEQAERTAWKIIQDWIEIQMSMVQMNQAEVQEVFMPYIWDGRETFYNRIKDSGYRALLPERSEAA